jgi:hypothetical protein
MTGYKLLETITQLPRGRYQTIMDYYGVEEFGFAELRMYENEIILLTQVLRKNKVFRVKQVESGGDFNYGQYELPKLLEKMVLQEIFNIKETK